MSRRLSVSPTDSRPQHMNGDSIALATRIGVTVDDDDSYRGFSSRQRTTA
jgi:hypothetical protein